ncbi:TonB-dependent receptor plug domain-containing protein [Gemmatimonas groenlandica]|uniref:TonB-dependent receptor plug domain-containing protein n=1 Tax=Gemmatimonas groenlandica TaxID=2732249 RepID=A0A6M4IKW4_9BACT|nr:TonB-dependent receptor plug domain-containing protein [Gemmatimonas groenlandica]QJR34518.1 TonB-dependent receptor plug domain-containing protein [Gemmatimonas groenlandica]
MPHCSSHLKNLRATRRWRVALAACAATALLPCTDLAAQVATPVLTGLVKGTVLTELRRPLVGAQIRFGSAVDFAESDDAGQFTAAKVSAGAMWLRVRRIGYRPESLLVTVVAGQSIEPTVTMSQIAQNIAAVKVIGRRDMTGPMAGFYKRLQAGGGRYFTQADIEKRQPNRMSDLLRSVPGIRIESRGLENKVRIRGARCSPLVWIDGQGLFAAEFDLDAVDPRSFEGIEVYSGPASVPMEFQGNQRMSSSCGTIVLWSRRGEYREKKLKKGEVTPAARIAQLLEEATVFTATDVDAGARVDSSMLVRPIYPDSLFDAQVAGELIAEFVVGTNGEAVMETFNSITTTHRALVEPVRRAVREQRFVPAVRKGRVVQQVMQLPFTFVPDSTARRRR